MENKKILLDVKSAKKKAEWFCAYQERHQQEVRDKLYEWGLSSRDIEALIAGLVSENFLNEERFARAYAGGKFRIKKWGRIKIKSELKKRNISEYSIKKAMTEISKPEYDATLKQLIFKKIKEEKGKLTPQKLYKIQRYLAIKGYEQELVWDTLKSLQED